MSSWFRSQPVQCKETSQPKDEVLRAALFITVCSTIQAWDDYDGGSHWTDRQQRGSFDLGVVKTAGGGGGGGGLPVGTIDIDPGVLDIGGFIGAIESINAGELPNVARQPVVSVPSDGSGRADGTASVFSGGGGSVGKDIVQDVTSSARGSGSGPFVINISHGGAPTATGPTSDVLSIDDSERSTNHIGTSRGGGLGGGSSFITILQGDIADDTPSADSLPTVGSAQDLDPINVQEDGSRTGTMSRSTSQRMGRGCAGGKGNTGGQSSDLRILSQSDEGLFSIVENDSARTGTTSRKVSPHNSHGGAGGRSSSGRQPLDPQILSQDGAGIFSIAGGDNVGGTTAIGSSGPLQISVGRPPSRGGAPFRWSDGATATDDVVPLLGIPAKSGKTVHVSTSRKCDPKQRPEQQYQSWTPTHSDPSHSSEPPAYTLPAVQKQSARPRPAAHGVHYDGSRGGDRAQTDYEHPTYQGAPEMASRDPLPFIRQLGTSQKELTNKATTAPLTSKPVQRHSSAPSPAYLSGTGRPQVPAGRARAPNAYKPPAKPFYPPLSKKRPEGTSDAVVPRYKTKAVQGHSGPAAPGVFFSGGGNRHSSPGKGRIQNAHDSSSSNGALPARPAYRPAISRQPQATRQHSAAYDTPALSYTTGEAQTSEGPCALTTGSCHHDTSHGEDMEMSYGPTTVGGPARVTSNTPVMSVGQWEDTSANQGEAATQGRWNSSARTLGNILPPKATDDRPWTPITPAVKVSACKESWAENGRFSTLPPHSEGAKSSLAKWPDTVSAYAAPGSEKQGDATPVILYMPAGAFTRSSQEDGFVRPHRWTLLILKLKLKSTAAPETEDVPDDLSETPKEL